MRVLKDEGGVLKDEGGFSRVRVRSSQGFKGEGF